MNNINKQLVACSVILLLMLGGCKKFLDIQPEDKVLETQVFQNKNMINTALNGLYINLTSKNLYGEYLTLSAVEVLAQRYNTANNNWAKVGAYAYNEQPTIDILDNIWIQAYSNILNCNSFLENLEKYPNILDPMAESLFKGEVIAMRAMLHFDMLRLYGPIYNTTDSLKQSIPYYEKTQATITPLLPANEVLMKVLYDLSEAEKLLEVDPIKKMGDNNGEEVFDNDFINSRRNYRLNYYAVKGLQARVHLYRGDKVSALKAAKEVIESSNKFPWTSTENALSEKANPDRVFSTEMIFGVMNSQLYNSYSDLFDPALRDSEILAPVAGRLNTVFEGNESDFRYNLNWQVPSTGIKSYRTFYKYADIIDKNLPFRFTIPVLKISEMYLIAAECESDVLQAMDYFNIVRFHRGLPNLSVTANLSTELQKEYQKEYFGEGQLFYYYKRKNIKSIGNGNSTSGNINVTFEVPLPLSEINYRQIN